jgi:hypothetical protein
MIYVCLFLKIRTAIDVCTKISPGNDKDLCFQNHGSSIACCHVTTYVIYDVVLRTDCITLINHEINANKIIQSTYGTRIVDCGNFTPTDFPADDMCKKSAAIDMETCLNYGVGCCWFEGLIGNGNYCFDSGISHKVTYLSAGEVNPGKITCSVKHLNIFKAFIISLLILIFL